MQALNLQLATPAGLSAFTEFRQSSSAMPAWCATPMTFDRVRRCRRSISSTLRCSRAATPCWSSRRSSAISRFTCLGVNAIGIPLDDHGIRIDALANARRPQAEEHHAKIHLHHPTVQNPTGTILPESRRAEMLKLSEQWRADLRGRLPCRPDLGRKRPPAIHAMSKSGNVIHIGRSRSRRARAARRFPSHRGR